MKTAHIFLLVLLTGLITSCRVTIPATDNVRPTFTLTFISDQGDIIHTFDEADNLGALTMNLQEGHEYNLLFVTRDRGGIKEASFTYATTMEVIAPMPNPDTPPSTWVEQLGGADNKTFLWTGDRNNPKDGTAYGVHFNASGLGQIIPVSFHTEDYGGSGIGAGGNERSGSLNIVYSTRPSGVE